MVKYNAYLVLYASILTNFFIHLLLVISFQKPGCKLHASHVIFTHPDTEGRGFMNGHGLNNEVNQPDNHCLYCVWSGRNVWAEVPVIVLKCNRALWIKCTAQVETLQVFFQSCCMLCKHNINFRCGVGNVREMLIYHLHCIKLWVVWTLDATFVLPGNSTPIEILVLYMYPYLLCFLMSLQTTQQHFYHFYLPNSMQSFDCVWSQHSLR